LTVDERRWSPLEYPKISNDKSRSETEVIEPKQAYFLKKRMQNRLLRVLISCNGYRNKIIQMSVREIEQTIRNFAEAARRVRETGCDG
jgi:2,4-dienoyl-CoA reductase-like NADH-dependent reductase (Old Yellow Enzyme family)